jgi:hypothetical protein
MKPIELLDRLRSPKALLALAALGVCTFGLFWLRSAGRQPQATPIYQNTNERPATSVVRQFVPARTFLPKAAPTPQAAPTLLPQPAPPPLAPLNIHVPLPAETNPPTLSVFAPAGRLIRAVTVNAVDSANTDTPVIALVTDPLWFDGVEVIPAGSELHGRANADRLRDRLVASGSWTIVWQNGQEMTVNGIALDRDDNESGQWGPSDGSAGLTGQVLRSDDAAEIKLFLSAFISGAAEGFRPTQNTLFGPQILGTARNAAIGGGNQVLNQYAQQIAESIRRDGFFVRVPAGKPMYLYLTHTLDRAQGRIGNLRVDALPRVPLAGATSQKP